MKLHRVCPGCYRDLRHLSHFLNTEKEWTSYAFKNLTRLNQMTYRLFNIVYNLLLHMTQIMQVYAERYGFNGFKYISLLYINGHRFIDTQRNFFYVKRLILLTLFCNLIF